MNLDISLGRLESDVRHGICTQNLPCEPCAGDLNVEVHVHAEVVYLGHGLREGVFALHRIVTNGVS